MDRGRSEVQILRYLILAITTLLVAALPAFAAEVIILQGSSSRNMEQMTRLVQNNCGASNRTLVLSDYAELDVERMVREEQPAVVVAIGDQALAAAKKVRRVPLVYGMALNTDENTLTGNISGVSMIVSPRSYLQLFAALKLRRIGVIHDKNRTGAYMRRAVSVAAAMGIELVPLQVRSPKEVPQRLTELNKRKVDALWLLPDSTAVTPETVDAYFTFAHRNSLPVIGYSAAYLTKGALAAVELIRQDVGRQLCDKVRTSKSGVTSGTSDAATGKVFFNDAVAEKLGIKVPLMSILPPTLSFNG